MHTLPGSYTSNINTMFAGSFDTYNVIKKFIKVGIPEEHTELIVHTMLESRDFDLSKLVTKEHFALLQHELETIRKEMATKTDLAAIEIKLGEFKYDILKWIVPLFIALFGMITSMMLKM